MSRLLLTLIGLVLMATAPNAVTAQDVYRVKAGDTLRVEVLEDPSLNQVLLVAPDGRISMPLAGGVRVGGQTIEGVQERIATRLAPNFANSPTVFVALQAERPRIAPGERVARTIDVYIVGEAARPGKLQVEPDTIVLQLFAEMGGFTNFAAQKRIQLRRDGKIYNLNYKEIEAGTSNAGMLELQDGDVLVIPQRRLFE